MPTHKRRYYYRKIAPKDKVWKKVYIPTYANASTQTGFDISDNKIVDTAKQSLSLFIETKKKPYNRKVRKADLQWKLESEKARYELMYTTIMDTLANIRHISSFTRRKYQEHVLYGLAFRIPSGDWYLYDKLQKCGLELYIISTCEQNDTCFSIHDKGGFMHTFQLDCHNVLFVVLEKLQLDNPLVDNDYNYSLSPVVFHA